MNQIFNEDCLTGMDKIPDGSVDMILCDLPYGTTACSWDVVIPFEPLWKQFWRVLKENGAIVLTAQQPFATDLINSCRKFFRYEIIWEKTQKLGFLGANRRPLRGHENVLVFYKKQPTYNPQKRFVGEEKKRPKSATPENRYQGYGPVGGNTYHYTGYRFPHSVLKISNWNGAGVMGNAQTVTKHPTQKPVELFRWLIRTYSNPGEVVLDACIGSGTTAVAGLMEGRRYIGFEKEPAYFKIAEERIAQFHQQTETA